MPNAPPPTVIGSRKIAGRRRTGLSSFEITPNARNLAEARQSMKPDLDLLTMIVELRAAMTVEEIARRAGISRNHVHRLQSGECRRPAMRPSPTYSGLSIVRRRVPPCRKPASSRESSRTRQDGRSGKGYPTAADHCRAPVALNLAA